MTATWPASPTSRSGCAWPNWSRGRRRNALAGRDALREAVVSARGIELDARLAVRTGEERVRAMAGRADELLRAANQERAARLEHEQARHLARAVPRWRMRYTTSPARCAGESNSRQCARRPTGTPYSRPGRAREAELLTLRTRSRELDEELVRLTDAVHRDEIARAEQRLRIESLETRVLEEYGVESRRCSPSTAQTSSRRRARSRWPSTSRPATAASR